MKVIRYAISKKDLHTLLKMIGVLRANERLLAVENVNLINDTQEVVVITVTTDTTHGNPDIDLTMLTDKELNDRFTQMVILENHQRDEQSKLVEEMTRIAAERQRRSFDSTVTMDGIPETVARNLEEQIRKLLESGNT